MTTPTHTGSSRLERAAFEVWYDRNRDDGPNMVLSRSMAEKAWFARAAMDAAPEPAPASPEHVARCTRCGEPITLMQSQLPDEVGLPCHKNCPLPATAAEVRAAALESAEREVVDAAVDFATMAAPDAEEWGAIRVVRLGRLVNAVYALKGLRASGPA